MVSGMQATTATTGHHLVARMTDSAQERGTRAKQNTNGVTDPIIERRLSAAVRPGYRPWT